MHSMVFQGTAKIKKLWPSTSSALALWRIQTISQRINQFHIILSNLILYYYITEKNKP